MGALKKAVQMACEALVMACIAGMVALALFAAAGFFGEAERHPSRKADAVQIVKPWERQILGERLTTSGYGYWDRRRERGR
jgi:hypothetical protein